MRRRSRRYLRNGSGSGLRGRLVGRVWLSKLGSFRYPVIIPSAVDDAGIYPDIFRQGNFNLLPLAHKSLIRYLIDDLHKGKLSDSIGDIHVVVDKELEACYEKQLGNRKKVNVWHEDRRRRRGILAAVNHARTKFTDDELKEPFMIFYGDTLLQDKVLKQVIEEADKLHAQSLKEGGSKDWCVVVFISDDERLLAKPYEKNRWGHIIVNSNMQVIDRGDPSDGRPPIWRLRTEDIRDVLYRPTYPDLLEPYCERRFEIDRPSWAQDGNWKEHTQVLVESGVLVFSPTLWQRFTGHQERRDPLGLKSIPFSARRLLIDNEFTVVGVVTDANSWLDVNYPWEYLQANEFLCRRLSGTLDSSTEDSGAVMPTPLDLEGTGFTMVSSTNELYELLKVSKSQRFRLIGTETSRAATTNKAHRYTHEYDSQDDWGVSKNVEVNGTLVLPDPAQNENLAIYIGGNVTFEGHCVIHEGTRIRANAMLNNANIGANCLVDCHCNVDHTVVMDTAKILSGAAITYSVIGRGAIIGGKSIIACEKLIAIYDGHEDPCGGDRESAEGHSAEPIDPDQLSKYHASTTIVRHGHRFGALIGDGVKLGANSLVQPGRKIGHESVISPGTEIRRNIPPLSEVTPSERGEE